MGGSEETRSIVYLDYWGAAARRRSSRLDPCSSGSEKVLQRSHLFCHLIGQPEFPSKSGSWRPLG